MDSNAHISALDAASGLLPLEWCFKDRLGSGAYAELILRRVKAGHEEPCTDTLESGFATHIKGKYSSAATFDDRLHDAAIADEQALWIGRTALRLQQQMAQLARTQPALLQLFAPKGKLEIYGEGMPHCPPQYIAGNHTIKLHVRDIHDSAWSHVLAHLMAQHLDYPVAKHMRRFSTSPLFDLCFTAEKVLAPSGLAAAIDAHLAGRGIYQPDRHTTSDADHVSALLKDEKQPALSGYMRVLMRERFATLVSWWSNPETMRRYQSTLLANYLPAVMIDLAAHKKQKFSDYPPKQADRLAQANHVPVLVVLNNQKNKAGKHDALRRRNIVG